MQIPPIHGIQSQRIDLQPVERGVRNFCGDHRFARNIGEVAHTAQQTTCDTGRPARALGNFIRAVGRNAQIEQAGSAGHNQFQFGMGVEIQPHRNAETVAQRRREQSLPRCRPDQREGGQIDPHRPRRWPFADHDIKRAVLHGRIENFLDHRT